MDSSLLFSFGPYGRWMPVVSQAAALKARSDCRFVHWNTENPPDLRMPWIIQFILGELRAALDRLSDSPVSQKRGFLHSLWQSPLNRRMTKFLFLGEYRYALKQGLLDVLANSSRIYTEMFTKHGFPAHYVPWGTSPHWFEQLNLRRDIDVVWYGKRRSQRRNQLLEHVRRELKKKNIHMFVADDVEGRYIFGEERTRILNRAKLTLNLLPKWYDNAFPYRFHVAAGNRSLVISEIVLHHCPEYQPGVHYVAVPPNKLVDAIQYYLQHPVEREKIAENAFDLVTSKLTMENSIRTMLDLAVDGNELKNPATLELA